MEFKTKFNLGDQVHTMHENVAKVGEVVGISVKHHRSSGSGGGSFSTISYWVSLKDKASAYEYPEYLLFGTKKELLESL